MNTAELLLPAIRWEEQRGFDGHHAHIDDALARGVGGFILFGGTVETVRELTTRLKEKSSIPLLIAADLERGAGQQFRGASGLPPLAAIGSLHDEDAVRSAAALTASEARELGLNWVYAPAADLDIEPKNPIIGTRALGSDPSEVARMVAAWVDSCQSERVMACAKHFPGHGRTTKDSHAELPLVTASREELERTDLVPFKAAVEAGVASVMSAHVAFPALDASRSAATLSKRILTGILREQLGFDGLIVTDALIMAGVRKDDTEAGAVVRALNAGCDLLLYPDDVAGVVAQLERSLETGALDAAALERSAQRRHMWAEWAAGEPAGRPDVARRAHDLAERVVHVVQGDPIALDTNLSVAVIDDDVGGPYPPPSRQPLFDALKENGFHVSESSDSMTVIALFGDIRAWKGRPGYSKTALQQLRDHLARARRAVIVQFSHPRLAPTLGVDAPIVCAWGGELVMQRAAAEWLARRRTA